jgi:hypothetical protein
MSGVGAKMARGPIGYKTRLQTTVAMSSTESKFMVACDAAEDNDGATAMANVQKPTSREPDTGYQILCTIRVG